jgi:cystathionine beta-lyase
MDPFDFDSPIERRGTSSIKWSRGERDGAWLEYPTDGRSPSEAEMLPMWLADMDFATAPAIVGALRDRVEHGVYGYTHCGAGFYSAVAGWSRRRHGWEPQPEWVFTNTGVMPAINLLIQTFTAPGDQVIVQPPVFHPIPEAAEINGRVPAPNPLRLVDGRYEMDLDGLSALAADSRTRMMILCSPHNPVGRVWTSEELAAVAEICSRHDVVLVSDEIHGDLTLRPGGFVSAGSLANHHDRIVVCAGPSKAFNLPALKLSLTIIPDPALRAAYETTLRNQNELWAANLFGTTALQAAYSEGETWLDALLVYLRGNFAHVAGFLEQRLPQLSLVEPDALYLAWIDCRPLGLDGAELDRRLRAAGLWVEQGATYGTEGEGFIRVTVACPRRTLEEAMRRLQRALG